MGLVREGRKKLPINACFSAVFTLFFAFTSFFLFSLLFFSILSISCLSPYPPSIYSYCSYLYWINLMWFLSFALGAYQLFLFVVNTFLELPITLLTVQPPLHLGMPSVFSLSHYPCHEKFLSVWFCRESFSFFLTYKASGLSLPIFLTCIKWS